MKTIAQLIVGDWLLIDSRLTDESGNSVTDPLKGAVGMISYSYTMRMSVQVMPKDYADKKESNEDYHAYYGAYSIDEENALVIHHVEGSNHPSMVNQSFARKVIFSDENTLSLCTDPAEDVFEDGRLLYHEAVWKRIK